MSERTIQEYARCNMIHELRAALARGADPNEKDKFGTTALQYAIAEKQAEIAAMLIQHGADLTIRDNEGKTALHYVIEHGMLPLAKVLLDINPRVIAMADKYGNEPLWAAVFNARGSYEMVSLLIRYGANPGHRNRVNASPLDFAKRINDNVLLHILDPARTQSKASG